MNYAIPTFIQRRPKKSLTARIREFFEANPDEELTHQDILTKFECNPRTAETALAKLRMAGVLESVHVVRLKETR